jgi:hypothetical protein
MIFMKVNILLTGKISIIQKDLFTMASEPSLTLSNGSAIPQLAFGLYMVPADDDSVKIILEAIKVPENMPYTYLHI